MSTNSEIEEVPEQEVRGEGDQTTGQDEMRRLEETNPIPRFIHPRFVIVRSISYGFTALMVNCIWIFILCYSTLLSKPLDDGERGIWLYCSFIANTASMFLCFAIFNSPRIQSYLNNNNSSDIRRAYVGAIKTVLELSYTIGCAFFLKEIGSTLDYLLLLSVFLFSFNSYCLAMCMDNLNFSPTIAGAEVVASIGVTMGGSVGYICGVFFALIIYALKWFHEWRDSILSAEDQATITQLLGEKKGFLKQIKDLNKGKSELEGLEPQNRESELQGLEKQLAESEGKNEQLQQNFEGLEKKLVSSEEQNKQLLEKLKGLEEEKKQLKQQQDKLEEEKKQLQHEQVKLEEEKNQLQRDKGELEEANEKLLQDKGELEEANVKLLQDKGELEEANEKLLQDKGEFEEANQNLQREKVEWERERNTLQGRIEELQRRITGLQNQTGNSGQQRYNLRSSRPT